jgi:diacylglycerol kinase (ATP)
MKLAIIANPVSGRGRPFRKLERVLRNWPYPEWEVELHCTRGPEHAAAIAGELLADPPDRLAVCGGDGTLREVATGVPDPPFPVMLLPGGTANVLAHEIGLPFDPGRALEVGLRGKVRRMDLGRLQSRQVSRFVLFVGIGFDGYVNSRVRPRLKRKIGIAAYYLEAARGLLSCDFQQFEVITGHETLLATSCLAANSHSYGGRLALTPEADMCDGWFDLLVVQTRSRWDYFRMLWRAQLGRAPQYPWLQRRRVASLRIAGPRGIWIQADGEAAGTLPVEVSLEPAKFPLVVPGKP